MITLAIVVPCYNEEEVLPETFSRLQELLLRLKKTGKVTEQSYIYFVDDGSRDRTWEMIDELTSMNSQVRGIKLSRNRGHQNAVLAGILKAEGDAVITVDADLQDDLNAIELMLDEHIAGAEIVYGVRQSRATDTFFKRFTAEQYYRVMRMVGVELVFNHADYRLMGRRAIEALSEYGEVNLFLRGIVPQLGYRTALVHYDRSERFAGESKYPLGKMLALALEGITSFTTSPLRMITFLGIGVSLLSLAITLWALGIRLFTELAVPGWTSTVVPIYFLGGVQLLCTGIIGEYLAKVYLETKHRPRYLIEKTTWDDVQTEQKLADDLSTLKNVSALDN